MRLRCPKCSTESDRTIDPTKGTHLEYQCDCGTKLQCDVPMASGGSLPAGGFAVNMKPPHACIHEDRFDASARVPILVV
jgi:hypothetical protein